MVKRLNHLVIPIADKAGGFFLKKKLSARNFVMDRSEFCVCLNVGER